MRQPGNATAVVHASVRSSARAAGPAGSRDGDREPLSVFHGRRVRAATALVLMAGALTGVAGCSFNSPVQTQKPYQPADGVEVNLGPIAIRNLLVVGTAADAPGRLAGLIVNSAATAQTVTITTPDGASSKAAVPAGATLSLSEGAGAITLAKAGAAAGSLVQLKLSTPGTGSDNVSVPVLLPQMYYATLTPTTTPTSGGPASTPGGLPSTATTGGQPATVTGASTT